VFLKKQDRVGKQVCRIGSTEDIRYRKRSLERTEPMLHLLFSFNYMGLPNAEATRETRKNKPESMRDQWSSC
jgi:hypothetical protein